MINKKKVESQEVCSCWYNSLKSVMCGDDYLLQRCLKMHEVIVGKKHGRVNWDFLWVNGHGHNLPRAFPKWGYPRAGWFIRENPMKMDDKRGYPLFQETSISFVNISNKESSAVNLKYPKVNWFTYSFLSLDLWYTQHNKTIYHSFGSASKKKTYLQNRLRQNGVLPHHLKKRAPTSCGIVRPAPSLPGEAIQFSYVPWELHEDFMGELKNFSKWMFPRTSPIHIH